MPASAVKTAVESTATVPLRTVIPPVVSFALPQSSRRRPPADE